MLLIVLVNGSQGGSQKQWIAEAGWEVEIHGIEGF